MAQAAPGWFTGLERATRAVNRGFASMAGALALAILGVVLWDVILRAVAEPTLWAHDVARFTLLYLFFFALAPALESGHHVAVDLFDRLLPPPLRRWQGHAAASLNFSFGVLLFVQLGRLTSQAFDDSRLATAVIEVPLKWLYVAGPLGAIQFVLTSLAQLGRAHWPPASPDGS